MIGEAILEETIVLPIQFVDPATQQPVNPTSVTVRIYEEDVLIGTASISPFDTKAITTVTNPNGQNCVINCVQHGLTQFSRVTISGVAGHALAINADHEVTQQTLTGDQFSVALNGNGGAAGTGGSWWITGFYKLVLNCTTANGYDKGKLYTIYIAYKVGSTQYSRIETFAVV